MKIMSSEVNPVLKGCYTSFYWPQALSPVSALIVREYEEFIKFRKKALEVEGGVNLLVDLIKSNSNLFDELSIGVMVFEKNIYVSTDLKKDASMSELSVIISVMEEAGYIIKKTEDDIQSYNIRRIYRFDGYIWQVHINSGSTKCKLVESEISTKLERKYVLECS